MPPYWAPLNYKVHSIIFMNWLVWSRVWFGSALCSPLLVPPALHNELTVNPFKETGSKKGSFRMMLKSGATEMNNMRITMCFTNIKASKHLLVVMTLVALITKMLD